MAIIHNGFIDRKFHDSFKDTGLNDVDIATTKMYKGVKPMWQQLGFISDSKDNPNNDKRWNNIIPSDYTFEDIDGIEVKDVINEDDDSVIGISSGMKTPRTSYKKINIEETWEQYWRGAVGAQAPYYPVLPRIDKYGIFTNNVDEIAFFGSTETWDEPDDSAPITNLNEQDNNLILNIDFDQTTTDDLIDKTNLSKIHYNQDFEVSLDKDLRLKTNTLIIPDGIEKNNSEQAF
jgi:hypothetical protein